jgi:DNA-binding NtrC family response regulator
MKNKILVIEDKPSELRLAALTLGYELNFISVNAQWNGAELKKHYRDNGTPSLVLIDMAVTGIAYVKIIKTIKAQKPSWPIIAIVPYSNDELAMQSVTAGANDFVSKPFTLDRLNLTIQNVIKNQNMHEVVAQLERKHSGYVNFSDIITKNPAMKRVIAQAEMLADSDVPVWFEGAKGTGKELLARAIHGQSAKAAEPFVVVDLAILTAPTVVTMIYGEVETIDSQQYFIKKMHEVGRGTLYIKAMQLLPESVQRCLLEVLESGVLPVLNESKPKAIEFRIMVASHEPIEQLAAQSQFMRLYKKLYGMVLAVPALSQRKEDIALLAHYSMKQCAAAENKCISHLSDDAIKLLEHHSWPGNIAQLFRTIQRAVLLCSATELDAGTLRLIQQLEPVQYSTSNTQTLAPTLLDGRGHIKKLRNIEEDVIRFALVHSGGSMTKAARNLGIGRSTLYRKLNDMDITPQSSRANQTIRPTIEISLTGRS